MVTLDYARGTELRCSTSEAGGFIGGRALCSDGRTRALARISPYGDTFFSVPAAVKVKGRTVTGFVMVETLEGWSVATDSDPAAVKFIAYKYGRNAGVLPAGAWKGRDDG